MDFEIADFNGAKEYYAGAGAAEWADLSACLTALPLCMQPSGQDGIVGRPIFDPKATNAFLTVAAQKRGWHKVPVPGALTAFGADWDAGKNETLAEWQFSNYPFLWNNVIRSEAVFKGGTKLHGMKPIRALVEVTKSGMFPASNSTLYFEQARAQLDAVTTFGAFEIPIRLVGLTIPTDSNSAPGRWTEYPTRYARQGGIASDVEFDVAWGAQSKYGGRPARITRR